jgi:hypothetical protein
LRTASDRHIVKAYGASSGYVIGGTHERIDARDLHVARAQEIRGEQNHNDHQSGEPLPRRDLFTLGYIRVCHGLPP